MSTPIPKTPEQQRAAAQLALKRAQSEADLYARDDETLAKLKAPIIAALAAVEKVCRDAEVTHAERLIVAAAVESNVRRHLLWKASSDIHVDFEDDEAKRNAQEAVNHTAVHNLAVQGKRIEKRLIEDMKVVGVGKMTMADVSKGS